MSVRTYERWFSWEFAIGRALYPPGLFLLCRRKITEKQIYSIHNYLNINPLIVRRSESVESIIP
jgi:hypothetical protein